MTKEAIEADPFGEANDETYGQTYPTTRDGFAVGSAEGGEVRRGRLPEGEGVRPAK